MGITNSGLNGYSALYLQSRLQSDLTRNETGQVYVGAQAMTVQTRTNHPLHLKSYCDEVGVDVPNSLTISNNASRDVIINTRLLIKGSDTIVDNNIVVNGDIMCTSIKPQGSGGITIKKLDGSNALKVYANGITQCSENIIADKNLTVSGNLTVTGTTTFTQANPHWVAVVITYVGGVPTILRNGGRYAATSLVRVSGQATGIFQFDFPEHPNGTNYIVNITANAGYGTIYSLSRSSTRFGITTRNISNVLFDTETHVLISAY